MDPEQMLSIKEDENEDAETCNDICNSVFIGSVDEAIMQDDIQTFKAIKMTRE